MDTEKIFSKVVLTKPESQRASHSSKQAMPDHLVRMGLNENPYGMAPKVLEAINESAKYSNQYPDFLTRKLKESLADFYHVTPDYIVTGSGSSPMIELTGEAFLNPDDEVLMCPTFGAFTDMAEVRLSKSVIVPLLPDKRYDLDGLLKAVTPKTKMVVICNPNNPTGQYRSYDDIKAFIEKLPKTVVVFMDEAYIEYATAPDCRSMLPLVTEMPDRPIVISRTFSKYYGMAGIRAGYVICQPEIAAGYQKLPFSMVPKPAQDGAIVALGEQDFYQEAKKKAVAGLRYLEDELEKLGCEVWRTQSNFILFDPHCDCAYVKDALLERGVQIASPMLLRVSVGTQENNEYFIRCMREILAEVNK